MEDSPFRQTLSTLTSTLTSTISIGTAVPKNIKEKLNSVHVHHSQVSDRYLSGGYNGNVGNFEVNFHFKGGIHWLKSTWSDTWNQENTKVCQYRRNYNITDSFYVTRSCHIDHIEKQLAKMNKLDDTVRTVGAFEYIITSDLIDSFWQRHVARNKLGEPSIKKLHILWHLAN